MLHEAGFFKRENFSCTPKKQLLENKNLLLAVLDKLRCYVVPDTFYYIGCMQGNDKHFMSLVVNLYRTQGIEKLDENNVKEIIKGIYYCNRENYRIETELNTFMVFLSEPKTQTEKNMLQSLEKNYTLEKELIALKEEPSKLENEDRCKYKYLHSGDCTIQ